MFACIFGQSVCDSPLAEAGVDGTALLNLAFTFSPLVEQTAVDTVVLNVEGQELLFSPINAPISSDLAWLQSLATEIMRCADGSGLKINVAMAAAPDSAIHAARSFSGITVIPAGGELDHLGQLPLKALDYSLAKLEEKRAAEISETLSLWGLHTFSDFARLPRAGVALRLGQEGLLLQKLTQGRRRRQLVLVQLPVGFEQSIELEHPIEELEPLSFILSRLLNQLCASLNSQALATNELHLRLQLENKTEHERTITLPLPMRNSKTFLRLLLLDIESTPPTAPITAVAITAVPAKSRVLQSGLFIPLAPEPEKLELTLMRLAKLVGMENVGSPELLDTHRPDAFRIKRFSIARKKMSANPQLIDDRQQCVMGFRVFRPPWRAEVQTFDGRPIRINAYGATAAGPIRGKVVRASGPWRTSGDWWRADVWARDEWDIAVSDPNQSESELLCRIYRDLSLAAWFVEGLYD